MQLNTVREIIAIPNRLYKLENISVFELLQQTGYFEVFDEITIENIIDELLKCPELVQDWITWSENKRAASGWYLKVEGEKSCIVGKLSNPLLYNKYDNLITASGNFIKMEIEDIRRSNYYS